jgi:uncharacterized protein (TIGR02466 family)
MNNNTFVLEKMFPSPMILKDFAIKNHSQIIDLSRKLVTQYNDNPFSYSYCRSTLNTKSDILEIPEFSYIKDQILTVISAYVTHHKINVKNLKLIESWLNQYDVHGYQDLHSHPSSVLSGVFYIKSAGNRDFSFQAPWHFFQGTYPRYTEITVDNSHNLEYESIEGRCMVWMSHLMHRTVPATEERISLSFNVSYT